MERTVPRSASDEVDLYLRTIYSLLRSTAEVQIRSLEQVHTGVESSLHRFAGEMTPDVSAFIYSLLRLPPCTPSVKSVVLGQSTDLFVAAGYANIEDWIAVTARARRRRCYFDGKDTLACYIASRSDIDDVVPCLTALQIEWNKLNSLLQSVSVDLIHRSDVDESVFIKLANAVQIKPEDLQRFRSVWGNNFAGNLVDIRSRRLNLGVRLLGGSLSQYWRATNTWWKNIEKAAPLIADRPVYFISSNTHSIVNLLTGFALNHEKNLTDFLVEVDEPLYQEWLCITNGEIKASKENLLYYAQRLFRDPAYQQNLDDYEAVHGVTRVPSQHIFDVDAQVIELARLDPCSFDPRLDQAEMHWLKESNALILNIDYPLGLAAYNILAKIAEHINPVLGIYIMGKSASLNGVIGDVMIPNVVHDEHSQNTYLFPNTFSAQDVTPYLAYGTVLDNQKCVSVLGTFLQNAQFMDVFYREAFSDIEMEAGPYLSAVYEMARPKRHPTNEIVNLYSAPFDIGILHYVSDTPLSKGKNLGAGTLSYFGMDSTYATTIVILKRILSQEKIRLTGNLPRSLGD